MEVQNRAFQIIESNKGKEHLFLDKSIVNTALAVELCKGDEYGLMDLAIITALSKQMERKIVFKKETGFTCPSCGSSRFWRDGHFCKTCGQHLDWNCEEEVM